MNAPNAFAIAADKFDPPKHEYLNDPHGWVKSHGGFLWSKQIEIAESVRDNRYTAVPSCHGPGKSYIVSRLAGWWLDVHPVGSAFVVSSAPTTPQIEAILWREIGGMHEEWNLPGRVTLDSKWHIGQRLVGYGRKPADYTSPEKAAAHFSGIHDPYILVILDEAGGIPKWLYDAADTLATNEDARVVAVGNPDDPQSHFEKVCRAGSGWNVIRIDAFDTPNFTGEKVPHYLAQQLTGKTWVKEREKRWGIGTPMWESKVRGRFPKISDDMLIQPAWVQAAFTRWDDHNSKNATKDKTDSSFGVDVARYGTDETVIYLREGGRIRLIDQGTHWATTVTTGKVKQAVWGHPARPVVRIDDVGVGGGVTDALSEDDVDVIPLNGGGAASDADLLPNGKKRFVNARSEWFWNLRLGFEQNRIDLEPDDDLEAQLTGIKWGVNRHGQIWVERKDDMKARGLPSPDRADGLCYAYVRVGSVFHVPDADQTERRKTLTGDLLTKGF